MSHITIGVSCGDINGIGLEVILKALALKKAGKDFRIIIYGSTKVVAYHKNIITQENIQFHSIQTAQEAQPDRINIINCWPDNV
ncbi:MAG: 4-hydroxythreonine-4-phosphate dehydrogenase PdxA, partial [Saprospiraceae bacterium]|nr:4-hydroxythreonine-4-phosphate dehydrogenase PdxA [Saprospiraceae bacterium]